MAHAGQKLRLELGRLQRLIACHAEVFLHRLALAHLGLELRVGALEVGRAFLNALLETAFRGFQRLVGVVEVAAAVLEHRLGLLTCTTLPVQALLPTL